MILLVRLAAFAFLIWIVFKLLKSVAQKALSKIFSPPPGADSSQIAEMVKDPVCGSYVSMDHAVAAEFAGERIYFCSDKCLSEYRDKRSGG